MVASLCVLVTAETAGSQGIAAGARFRNLAQVYPRGVPCEVYLDVSAADRVEFDVSGWLARAVPVRNGQARFRVETSLLRSGDYEIRARLLRARREVGLVRMPLTVAAPRDPDRMPVWNWMGIGGARESDPIEDSRVRQESGFTGGLIGWRMDPAQPSTGRTEDMRLLDQAARLGFDGGGSDSILWVD